MSQDRAAGPSPPASLPLGQVVAGRYRVTAHLGTGGMGEVYEVEHALLGKRFALKRLLPDGTADQAAVERFLREARAAAATGHPGVVDVVDVGFAEDGLPYLVMERLTGETLRRRLERGPLDVPTLLGVGHAILDALAAVHAASIIHRDIKPENLFLCGDGRLKILDFGLSHDTAVDVRLTRSGAVLGTPLYMSPEQARGEALDARVDLYAVGAVLYECASGRPPFAAPAYSVLVALILEVPPDATRLAHLPAGARAAILAALAKRATDRPASAAAMREALGPAPAPTRWGPIPSSRDDALAEARTVATAPPAAAPASPAPAPPAAAPATPPPDERPPADPPPASPSAPTRPARPAPPPRRRPRWWWAALPAAGLAAAGALVAVRRPASAPPPPPPIEVTRSQRLTLDEGCEEYPRFTPEGDRVVYDGLIDGDSELLSIALDGSDRRRLTHTPGWDYAPAISPDGTRIAYVHEDGAGRTLRVIGAAGDRAGPTHDLGQITGYPAWTRDGALLSGDAAGRILRRELAAHPSGEIERETVLGRLPAGARPYHLAAIEGAGVAILWWSSSEADATALGELDRDGRLRVIEEATTDYEGGLAASPTRPGYYATRKGAATGNQILWRPWGGGAPRVVPGGLSPGAGLDVAADGRRLVFSTCVEKAYVARLREAAEPVVISRGEWHDTGPVALAGDRMLITSDRMRQQQGWLVELGTGAARPVTPPDSHGASPSRDGRHVVYAAEGGRGGLAVIAVAGGPPRRLTDDPSDTAPTFTRDGQHVVFARSAAGRSRIHVVPADGGAARPLADGTSPAASPAGDQIAFIAEAGVTGARQVLLTDLTGAPPRPIPGLAPAAWHRPRFSPDGTRLLLIRGFQEIVEVALDGRTPATVRWTARSDSVLAADWAADGDGILAALGEYRGDLWLAEGVFP
jgi:eukaryotic-like serine/threonine-protein kinase